MWEKGPAPNPGVYPSESRAPLSETRWLRWDGRSTVLGYRETRESGCWVKGDAAAHIQAHSHAEGASYSERLGFKFKSSLISHCLTRSASPGRTIQRSWERGCGSRSWERVARVYRRERPTLRAQSHSDQSARRGNIHSVTDFLITPLLHWINTANNRLGICFAA